MKHEMEAGAICALKRSEDTRLQGVGHWVSGFGISSLRL